MIRTQTLVFAALALVLAGCSSFQRADDAAAAQKRMPGLTREEVLACMGPARKKASEGATEVWSYLSTNGLADSQSSTYKPTGYVFTTGSRDKSFCTVNVVMRDGVVTAVHYNGPSGGLFDKNEQCGYAVANCIDGGSD